MTRTRWEDERVTVQCGDRSCAQEDLEAELLESPEREPVSQGRTRRNFGTCQAQGPATAPPPPELNLME